MTSLTIPSLTLSAPGCSHELLTDARLCLQAGHRYGLVGRNGVGKSVLLQYLHDIAENDRTVLVQQDVSFSSMDDNETPVTALVRSNTHLQGLWREQEALEAQLELT